MTSSVSDADDDPHSIRFGYNLADLYRLARIAMSRAYGHSGDWDDLYQVAWSGLAEALAAATEPPDWRDLVIAGARAVQEHRLAYKREHGIDTGDGHNGVRFAAYWSRRVHGSPERRIVEHLTLWTIWSQLTRRQQQVLVALATYENHDLAAQALEMTRVTYRTHLSDARTRFFRAWHEGEQPAGLWRRDKRTFRRDGLDHQGKPRLSPAQIDQARDRRFNGETVAAIAADFGCHPSVLGRALSGHRSRPVG